MKNFNENPDPILERKLGMIKEVPARQVQAARNGRARFLTQAVSMTHEKRHTGWKDAFAFFLHPGKERKPMFSTIMAVFMAIALVFGGTGGAVYAAQTAMPEDALYFLKTASEDVTLALTSDETSLLELNLQYAERRMAEIGHVLEEGDLIPARLVTRLNNQINAALHIAALMEGEEQLQALRQIQSQLVTQEQLMTQLQANADPAQSGTLTQTQEMLHTQLRLVDGGLEDPTQLQEQIQIQLQESRPETAGTPQGPAEAQGEQNGNAESAGPQAGDSDQGNGAGDGTGPIQTGTCTPTGIGPYPWGTSQPGYGNGGKP